MIDGITTTVAQNQQSEEMSNQTKGVLNSRSVSCWNHIVKLLKDNAMAICVILAIAVVIAGLVVLCIYIPEAIPLVLGTLSVGGLFALLGLVCCEALDPAS